VYHDGIESLRYLGNATFNDKRIQLEVRVNLVYEAAGRLPYAKVDLSGSFRAPGEHVGRERVCNLKGPVGTVVVDYDDLDRPVGLFGDGGETPVQDLG